LHKDNQKMTAQRYSPLT